MSLWLDLYVFNGRSCFLYFSTMSFWISSKDFPEAAALKAAFVNSLVIISRSTVVVSTLMLQYYHLFLHWLSYELSYLWTTLQALNKNVYFFHQYIALKIYSFYPLMKGKYRLFYYHPLNRLVNINSRYLQALIERCCHKKQQEKLKRLKKLLNKFWVYSLYHRWLLFWKYIDNDLKSFCASLTSITLFAISSFAGWMTSTPLKMWRCVIIRLLPVSMWQLIQVLWRGTSCSYLSLVKAEKLRGAGWSGASLPNVLSSVDCRMRLLREAWNTENGRSSKP